MSAIDDLCPRCGLCCNGVLFGDVELQTKDAPKRLSSLGLALHRKGQKHVFNQPCACLVNGLCRIYESRPRRCRTFDCRVLQRVQRGEMTLAAARKAVAAARTRAGEVLLLVRELGDARESEPLSRRYSAIMAEAFDFANDDASVERRAELMLAVGRLVEVLRKDFLCNAAPQAKR